MSAVVERAKRSVSKSFKKLNPSLFNGGGEDDDEHALIEALTAPKPPPKRLRQDSKPLLNKLESEWQTRLKAVGSWQTGRVIIEGTLRAQARRYKLANGAWYKPDFTATTYSAAYQDAESARLAGDRFVETAWEVKGPKAWRGGFEFLKIAAHQWPEVKFILAYKGPITGSWVEQSILP